MRRRELLLAAAAAAWHGLHPSAAQPAAPIRPLGLHLGTLRELLALDLEDALRAVAAIGYRDLEFAGHYGREPQEIRRLLASLDLTAPAAHVPLGALEDDPVRTFQTARSLGYQFLVASPLGTTPGRDLDEWHALAQRFNTVGYAVRAAGFRFAYHNRDHEFTPLTDHTGYDILVEQTDPDLVAFELDVYWMIRAGGDPLELFRRFPGRFPLVHVTDMAAAPDLGMTDLGEGVIDYAAILAAAGQAGLDHLFVAFDDPPDPLTTARTGYRHLRSLGL